jgi:hypothetical protein
MFNDAFVQGNMYLDENLAAPLPPLKEFRKS